MAVSLNEGGEQLVAGEEIALFCEWIDQSIGECLALGSFTLVSTVSTWKILNKNSCCNRQCLTPKKAKNDHLKSFQFKTPRNNLSKERQAEKNLTSRITQREKKHEFISSILVFTVFSYAKNNTIKLSTKNIMSNSRIYTVNKKPAFLYFQPNSIVTYLLNRRPR